MDKCFYEFKIHLPAFNLLNMAVRAQKRVTVTVALYKILVF